MSKTTKILSLLVCFLLIFEQSGFAQAASQLDISAYLVGLRNGLTQDKFRPLHLRYLSYDNATNQFNLLIDKGNLKDIKQTDLEANTQTLLNYFLVGVTLPNDSFWVNLRPDAETNIIDDELAKTDIGRIMLEADVQLKKDTARYTSPNTSEGKEYWDKLYRKAGEIFGYENVEIPTLTRPWIVPDEVLVGETKDGAYIFKATLRVMLEQDYLKDSTTYNFKDERLKALNEYSPELIRELIIPKITKEVNSAKRYALLRQVYYSLILAQWFKARFKDRDGSLLEPFLREPSLSPGHFPSELKQGSAKESVPPIKGTLPTLIDPQNLNNLTSKSPWNKATYFKEYQNSFKQGEYHLKEPHYTAYGQVIRSYLSGGIKLAASSPANNDFPADTIPSDSKNLSPMKYNGNTGVMRTGDNISNRTIIASSPVAPRRLTIDECRAQLLENMRDLKTLWLALQKELAYGLEILKTEGVEAFEKKAYPKIKEASDRVKVKVIAIRTLPAIFGFSEPEVRGKLDTFLQQIAEGFKVDKVLIWFEYGWAYDFTYTLGFSEEELLNLKRNQKDIFRAIADEEVYKKMGRDREVDRDIIAKGIASMRDSGMVSGLQAAPSREKWVRDTAATRDNNIVIVIGRSEEFVKTYGDLTERDRKLLTEKLDGFIDAKSAPWWGIRDYLNVNHYYDFDVFMLVLRHNGGVDIFDVSIFTYIYSRFQQFIDNVRANDSESQKWLDAFIRNLNWLATQSSIVTEMDTFLQILEKGTEFRPRNITLFVHNRVEPFRQEAMVKGLIFTTDLSNEDFIVPSCDLNLLGVVIDNLIQNAIKYTKDGSVKVRLTRKMMKEQYGAEKERDSAVLEVEDTGIGIPQDEKSKIFGRGYRASNVADIQGTGTGTGLDVVNIVTRLMRGDVMVESEVGKGTTFTIRLPITQDTEPSKLADKPTNEPMGSSPIKTNTLGGIDFRSFPIVIQAISNLKASNGSIPKLNLNSAWQEIERLVQSGITPSGERMKEYLQVSCYQGKIMQDRERVINCIFDILRQQEEYYIQTEPVLRDILIVLESGRNLQELQAIFIGTKP